MATHTESADGQLAPDTEGSPEWMLAAKAAHFEPPPQPYGDLALLNTCRRTADSVGTELLTDIVREFLDLLDTSAAVHETNGDYAIRMFDSSYCRLLDEASFRLCGTSDLRQALASGRWRCHESC